MATRKTAAVETAETTVTEKVQHEFSKEQIVASARYRKQRDLVNALLDSGKMYTLETVDEMISKFMKGKVK